MTLDIRIVATGIPPGASVRTLCPQCYGGTDAEPSFSIQKDAHGNVRWKCYRASCGFYGGDKGTGYAKPAKKEPRIYTRPISELTPAQKGMFRGLFGIDPKEVAGYSPEHDRFLFGVYGPRFSQFRGYVARSFSGDKPKTLSYNEKPDEPFIHWTSKPAAPSVVVVVEDWLSAEKVELAGLVGVSLQGTYLSREMVDEIASQALVVAAPVYLAFDRDAYAKSLEYQQMYRERFPNGLKVARLGKDLKYVSVEKIKHEFESGTADFIGNY